MPLTALGELLSFCEDKEIDKQLYPMWLCHFSISQLIGAEFKSYDEVKKEIKIPNFENKKNVHSADEIIKKFTPIVELDLKNSRKGGE